MLLANLIPVAKSVGVNKMVPTISIPYPLGDPSTTKEEQYQLRHHRVGVALDALTEDVSEPTLFKVSI